MKYAIIALYAYMALVTHAFLYQAETRGIVLPYWKHATLVALWPAFYAPVVVYHE